MKNKIFMLLLLFFSSFAFVEGQNASDLLYKTHADYPNETGFNQLAYPIRDAIPLINPWFVVLIGLLAVLTTASYYAYAAFTGKTRFFASLLASSFSVTVISFMFAFDLLITPYHVLTFIGITVLSFILIIFYR